MQRRVLAPGESAQNALQPLESQKSFLTSEPGSIIWSDLDFKALAAVGATCKFFHHQSHFNQLFFDKLAKLIVWDPKLDVIDSLLSRVAVVSLGSLRDLLGRKSKAFLTRSGQAVAQHTLLQLAYAQGDVELCRLLKEFFIKAHGSKLQANQMISAQINEKHNLARDEGEALKQITQNYLRDCLEEVFAAIENEDFSAGQNRFLFLLKQETLDAINQFKKNYSALFSEKLDSGMHYDDVFLLPVFEYYRDLPQDWDIEYWKLFLFEDAVLAVVLSRVPAHDAMKFWHGLGCAQTNFISIRYDQLQRDEYEWLYDKYYKRKMPRVLSSQDGDDYYQNLQCSSSHFDGLGACHDISSGHSGFRRWQRQLHRRSDWYMRLFVYFYDRQAMLQKFYEKSCVPSEEIALAISSRHALTG